MAKSPVRKSPPISKKKFDALAKRIEALENQSFTQQLLIDELENKLEQAEKNIKDVRDNPFQLTWTPPPAPHQTYHTCVGVTDMFGTVTCTICGRLMSTGVTITSNNTVSSDDIVVTWAPSDDSETKG